MSIETTVRAAFAGVLRRTPKAVVTVAYKDRSGQGLRGPSTQQTSQTAAGNKGTVDGVVKIDASFIDPPVIGETMKVGGKEVFINQIDTDLVGAILKITFSETRQFVDA